MTLLSRFLQWLMPSQPSVMAGKKEKVRYNLKELQLMKNGTLRIVTQKGMTENVMIMTIEKAELIGFLNRSALNELSQICNTPPIKYQILNDGKAIKCCTCGLKSHNPNDVRERFCGFCDKYHDD